MSGYSGVPKITGEWVSADSSPHHLQFAQTERTQQDGILAMRSNVKPENVTPVTVGQLRDLANAIKPGGTLAHLIEF